MCHPKTPKATGAHDENVTCVIDVERAMMLNRLLSSTAKKDTRFYLNLASWEAFYGKYPNECHYMSKGSQLLVTQSFLKLYSKLHSHLKSVTNEFKIKLNDTSEKDEEALFGMV